MNKLCLTFLIWLSCIVTIFGQTAGLKNFKWQEKPEPTPVYEKYAGENAYIIKERKSISFSMDSKGIYVYTNIKRKIKILTQSGVDNYARIVVPRSAGRKLSLLDARTIKKNGEIVDLDIKEVKEVDLADDDKLFNKKRYLLFSIPGVEAGDEIEFIAGYGGYGADLGQDIYLHSYLNAVNSEVIINQVKALILDIRFYNNLAYPKQKETDTEITYQWESADLASLENQPGCVPALELPYISYRVKKIKWGPGYEPMEVVGDAWTSAFDWFAKNYVNTRLVENSRDGKVDDFLQALWTKTDANDIVTKVKAVHSYFNDNMKVVDLPDNEENMAMITYINNLKTDEPNLFRIYQYLLNKISPELYLCMAREFYEGPIDFTYVAFQQINKLLFSFKDEKEVMHYLMPRSDDEKFELDEIDGTIQGTQYVAINLRGKNLVTNPKLPFNMPTENLRSRQAQVIISTDKEEVKMELNETLQGVYSTNYRHFYEHHSKENTLLKEFGTVMKERNEKAGVDSISIVSFENSFPFTYKIVYGFTIPDAITKMDENLYSVSIENWFYHNVSEINSKTRSMDYYFSHLGRDVFKYFLVFDKDVKLMNAEKLKKYASTNNCHYSLELTQINPKTILVESAYQIKNIRVPLAETAKYEELYQKMKDADNEPVIIKIL